MTRRLLVSYLSLTVLVLLLLEIPLAIFFQQRELDQLTAAAERDATVLASIYEDALEDQIPTDPLPARQYALDTNSRVVVVDVDGISVVDTQTDERRDFSTRPEFESALAGSRSVGTRFSETAGTELLFVAVPVASGGRVHGALRLTLDTDEVDEQVQRFWLGLVAVAVVVLATVAGLGWAIARWITRPVRHLQAAAARFALGDLTPTEPDSSSPPEIVELERSMNTMAARLERLLDQQREFVADASHQLRTPLTGLRLRLENLQIETSDDELNEELGRAVEETDRLAGLVAGLLQLAEAEKPPVLRAVNLSQLARDRVDTWSAVADESAVGLRLEVSPTDVIASTVPGASEQILDNLIDNALAHSEPGSTVSIELDAAGPTAKLTVADHGEGLDEENKRQALDRFWRGDVSRPGTGLGLAIVLALVKASGGEMELEDNEPTGLKVVVSLPVAKTDVSNALLM